ncbi:MAG: hypothetical protein WD022_07520 [Balneolaceae bacterium]
MRTIFGFLLCVAVIISGTQSSKAQTIELLAGNTLNGAVNGTLLGGATMALNNDTDFRPLQVGLGLGTLYGLGMGAYDVSTGGGNRLLVSGLFNDGNNTSIIVLLDTFYGAAAGTIIATSVMLVADEPLIEGLRYGSSVGAWIGFGVGIVDAFMFSDRITQSAASLNSSPNAADGLVGIHFSNNTSIGLVSPSLISTYQTNGGTLTKNIKPTIDIVNLKLSF